MLKTTFRLLSLVALLGLVTPACAGSLVSLSSASDLSSLQVGDQVQIDVTLSGLESGNFIFNLLTQILFPSSNFVLVSGPTASTAAGSAFFADAQVANFNANSGPLGGGGVAGNYPDNTPTSGAIGQNGLFYSFVLQATSAGSGTIGFDPTPNTNRFSGTETGFAFAPLPTGDPLAFTVVPEPSSAVLALTGLAIAAGFVRRRRSGASA
jgi:hypothetical protein